MIFRHHHEASRPSNTARIAALALSNVELIEWVPRTPPDVTAVLANQQPAMVLYPGPESDVARVRPATLVVLDATWKQARKMLHHHPTLSALPRFALGATAPRPRLRQPHTPEARSTLEAIADALTLLEGPDVGAPLQRLHETLVERVLSGRGRASAK